MKDKIELKAGEMIRYHNKLLLGVALEAFEAIERAIPAVDRIVYEPMEKMGMAHVTMDYPRCRFVAVLCKEAEKTK